MLKGKGKIPNLSPFPLPLFPTSARSLLWSAIAKKLFELWDYDLITKNSPSALKA
jgi:hypothetical protein